MFDAETVGDMLAGITPGLLESGNFHWPPWRALVADTARYVLNYTGGVLIIPMTVLDERYWREISTTVASYDIPVRHFVLHPGPEVLRARIDTDVDQGPTPFRLRNVEPYVRAAAE